MATRTTSGRSTSTGSRSTSTGARSTDSRRDGGREPVGLAVSPEPRLGTPSGEVQPYDTLRSLPIGLPEEARGRSVELLNGVLADTTIVHALYKKHHWLVAGPTFYALHLLFDKHAEEQEGLMDLLAERVQTLGGIAAGDPRQVAELTSIERAPDGAETVPDMLTRQLRAHESLIGRIREAIQATEESKDYGSNDLLMSEVLRTNELQVWFVSAHLVEMPLVEP